MYKRITKGWMKHLDFILLDLVCLHLAYFLSFFIRNGRGNVYQVDIYQQMAYVITLISICVAFVSDNYKGILHRGYLKEVKYVFTQSVYVAVFEDECLYYYRMDVQNSLTYKNYHEFKEQEYWKQRFMAYKRFEETFVYYDLFYKNKEQVELLLKKYLISTMKMCCKNKLPKEKIITFIGEINSDPYIQSRINNGKFMSFSDKFRMNLMRNDKLIILYYLEKTRYLIGNLLLIIMKSK